MKKIFYLAALSIVFSTSAQNPGALDTTFNLDANSYCSYAILPLASGQFLVAGSYNPVEEIQQNGIIKLNSNGSIDNTFNAQGTGTSTVSWIDVVNTIAVQDDGKIIIGGIFTHYNNIPYTNKIVRLNSDGSLDTTFSVIGNAFQSNGLGIRAVIIQPNGKILVAGASKVPTPNGEQTGMFRLNTDGSIDTAFPFNYGTGMSVVLQPDGKIIFGGGFTSFNNQSYKNIIRLNADGTADTTFSIGIGFNGTVYNLALQNDGKIIVTGEFTSYNEQPYNRIVRLNSDGSIDTTFNVGTGLNSVLYYAPMAIQSNGKILIGGAFTSYNGAMHNYIVRLNSNGSVDTTFNVGTGFNNLVFAIGLEEDGKILIGGLFDSYNGQPTANMVRLHGDGSLASNQNTTSTTTMLYPNPANDSVTITTATYQSMVKVIDVTGKLVYSTLIKNQGSIDTSAFANGVYFVQISTENQFPNVEKLLINR